MKSLKNRAINQFTNNTHNHSNTNKSTSCITIYTVTIDICIYVSILVSIITTAELWLAYVQFCYCFTALSCVFSTRNNKNLKKMKHTKNCSLPMVRCIYPEPCKKCQCVAAKIFQNCGALYFYSQESTYNYAIWTET